MKTVIFVILSWLLFPIVCLYIWLFNPGKCAFIWKCEAGDTWWIEDRNKVAGKIKKCFADVDWSRQVFHCGGVVCKCAEGEEHFYRVKPIDEAIKKLNSVLNDIRGGAE